MFGRPWSQLALYSVLLILPILCAPRDCPAQTVRGNGGLGVIQEKHRDRVDEFVVQLEKLAVFCEGRQLTDAAATVRSRMASPVLDLRNLKSLPAEVQPDIPNNLSADERYWQTQLRFLEKEYAQDLLRALAPRVERRLSELRVWPHSRSCAA